MKKLARVYTFLVILGGLSTLAELILSLMNSSLCSSVGCRIVESYLRFDERYMYALGFLFFCALYISERTEVLRKFSGLLLMCALAAEGYLVGFQLFIAQTVCPYCIALASIIAGIALLKLISGAREPMLAGFCLFLLTGALVGSINTTSTPIPSGKYVLIYSKDCLHCEEVIRFSREKAIPLTLCEAGEVTGALRSIGIDSVPVLVCNDVDGKKIYSGANNIKAVLTARLTPHSLDTPPQVKSSVKKPQRNGKEGTQEGRATEILNKTYDPFIYSGKVGQPTETYEGACSIGKSSTTCE
jgi:hypothetical protein